MGKGHLEAGIDSRREGKSVLIMRGAEKITVPRILKPSCSGLDRYRHLVHFISF